MPRAMVTVNSLSQVTVGLTTTNAYTTAHFRGAASDGTNNFWGSGSKEGTWYLGLDGPAALLQGGFLNTRSVDIFNGNLYTLASATDFNGLLKFNGLPRTDQGNVYNILEGFSSTTTTDFVVDPTDTLIYLTVGSSVQRWDFNGSTWVNTYTLTGGLTEQARYITADFSGAAPVLYLTTAEAGNGENRLLSIVDTNSLATAFPLAASGRNQLFKGIRFGPAPTLSRPTLSFSRVGSDLILNWTGSFALVSSTNISGPYLEVPSATSPFTNSTASATGRFFGLR